MKILIVDDEALIRSSLRMYIERFGIPPEDIWEAGRAAEMAAELNARPIDVAFVDVRMPGPDGLDAIAQCQQQHPDTSFYVISGFSDFSYAQRALRLHVADYLLKPIAPDVVQSVLQKEQARLDSRAASNEAPHDGDVLSAVRRYIEEHYADDITVGKLAGRFGLTPNYLSAIFKRKYGMGIVQLLTGIRIRRARTLLAETELPVQDVAESCGYADAAYFAKVFLKQEGCTPASYRRTHRESV